MQNNSNALKKKIHNYWEKEYECTTTQFDVDEPDEWIAKLEMSGKIYGNVLDAGCGPGRTAMFLADLGYNVLGVDISDNAIKRAKLKAEQKGCTAQFLQSDMCELSGYDNHFDTVIDIGCFHSLIESDRNKYAAALHRLCREEAVIFLRAFSDMNMKKIITPGEHVPFLNEEQIRTAFTSNGWIVKNLVQKEIDLLVAQNEVRMNIYVWYAEIYLDKKTI